MSDQISRRELRNDSGRIMRALDDEKSFLVSRHGRVLGELRPLRRDRFIDARDALEAMRGAPEVERERLRADLDEVAVQELDPRD